jgi:hypothetical protein
MGTFEGFFEGGLDFLTPKKSLEKGSIICFALGKNISWTFKISGALIVTLGVFVTLVISIILSLGC